MTSPQPLIAQWLAEGKYTCTTTEFAKLIGVKPDTAREICKSAKAPPGFYSGNRYKILVSELDTYLRNLASRKEIINV